MPASLNPWTSTESVRSEAVLAHGRRASQARGFHTSKDVDVCYCNEDCNVRAAQNSGLPCSSVFLVPVFGFRTCAWTLRLCRLRKRGKRKPTSEMGRSPWRAAGSSSGCRRRPGRRNGLGRSSDGPDPPWTRPYPFEHGT